MNQRFRSLDAIRGIGALIIMFYHILLIFPFETNYFLKFETIFPPLFNFVSGSGPVMLFFVLSGFVLSIPFYYKDKINYIPYLIRRLFRIYFPYFICLNFSIILSFLISGKVNGLSDWFNGFWNSSFHLKEILGHYLLLGNIHTNAFDPVIWSLVQEMRISIIFPFIVVLLVKKFNWKWNFLVCFALAILGGLNNKYHFQVSNGINTTFFDTLRLIPIFIVGSLLAKHIFQFSAFFLKLTLRKRIFISISLIIVSIFLEVIVSGGLNFLIGVSSLFVYVNKGIGAIGINDYYSAIIGIVIMLITLGSSSVAKFLSIKPLLFLGKISYSLYLYHLPVLITLFHLLNRILFAPIIILISIIVSMSLAYLSWRFIEEPCRLYGNKLANKFKEGKRGNKIKPKDILISR
jgi:peptidoglycan/LPS O-acetylase OafA/YrhL